MNAQEIAQRVANADYRNARLSTREYEFSPSTPGERSVFAEFQAEVPVSIRPATPVDLAIPAYQRIASDGSGNESEYQFDHGLADDPAMGNDLVLYSDGDRIEPASIDYSAGSFTYADGDAEETLDAFYLSDEQAALTLRIVAPRNQWNEPLDADIGLYHIRDTNDDPITFEPEKTELDGVVPTDYRLEWGINAPYEVRRSVDDTGATATNMLLSLPIWKAQSQIEGLDELKAASVR